MTDIKTTLKNKRAHFIGDRVALSQCVLLALTGVLVHLLTMNPVPSSTLNALIWLAVLGSIASWVFIEVFKVRLFFECHWLVTFLLLSCFWLPVTVLIGYLVDTHLHGFGNTLFVSMVIMMNYAAGYILGRLFHSIRSKMETKKAIAAAIWLIIVLVLVAVLAGVVLGNIHVIVSGVGISLSFVFAYMMLRALFDEGGMDVVEDPPNKLFMVCLRNSLFLTLLFWVIVLTLFPVVPGGGGGKNKRGKSSSGFRSSRRSRSRNRYYGGRRVLLPPKEQQVLHVRTYNGYPDTVSDEQILQEIMEGEWAEHKLAGYHGPSPIATKNYIWHPPTWVRAGKTSDPSIGNYELQFDEQTLKAMPEEQRAQLLRHLNGELKAIIEEQGKNDENARA